MTVVYRLLHPDEEDAAVALWMRVLGSSEEEARQTFRDFRDEPERFERAHVAVAGDGQLLATVCYWLREVRGVEGEVVPVGHLYHVATEPTARRQGHASRLLAGTLRALRAAGCQWAILSARPDAVALYTRAGWQPAPRTYWRGACSEEPRNQVQPCVVQPYDPRRERAGWAPLAAAYERANARQPASLIRTPVYWSGYWAWMVGLYLDVHHAVLLAARRDSDPREIQGYALANFYEMGFVVSEMTVDPDDPALLRCLLNGIVAEAKRRGIPLRGQLAVPAESRTLETLYDFFGESLHTVEDTALHGYVPFMVRPLGDDRNSPFSAPGALFWPLDAY